MAFLLIMSIIKSKICLNCGNSVELISNFCSNCKKDSVIENQFDYDLVKERINKSKLQEDSDISIVRYKDILPISIDHDHMIPIKVGFTPIYKINKLEKRFNINNIYVKDEGRNPNNILNDRGSYLAVLDALSKNCKTIIQANSANSAISLASLASSTDIQVIGLFSENTSIEKIYKLDAFNSKYYFVSNSLDDAYDLAFELANRYNLYFANNSVNPILIEGYKTVSYEICEQLSYNVPDYVLVPLVDGATLASVYKGFYDFYQIGFIDRIPKIIGISPESNLYIKKFIKDGLSNYEISEKYKNIYFKKPKNLLRAVKSLKESDGFIISVSNEEIYSAINDFSMNTGIYTDFSGGIVYAGLIKMYEDSRLSTNDKVLLLNSSNVDNINRKKLISENRIILNNAEEFYEQHYEKHKRNI